jgi:hypothetical protein
MEKIYVQYVMKFGRFEPEREELTGDWRKLYSEDLYDLYCLSNVLINVKEDEMGSECGICVGERRNVYGGNMKIRGKLEDLDGDRIILKWILKMQDGRAWNRGCNDTYDMQS